METKRVLKYYEIISDTSLSDKEQHNDPYALHLSRISHIEEFCAALFILRDKIKKMIFAPKKFPLDQLTAYYVVLDECFFFAYRYMKNGEKEEKVISDDSSEVRGFILSVYTMISNDKDKEQKNLSEQESDRFYDRTLEVSTMNGDINTETIQDQELLDYLDERKLTPQRIQESISGAFKDFFYSGVAQDAISCLRDHCGKTARDTDLDIIIIDKDRFCGLPPKTREFISAFLPSETLTDYNETEQFVFTLMIGEFVFISPNVMKFADWFINATTGWGQYIEVPKRFDLIKDSGCIDMVRRNYNKYLTYVIADFLRKNEYILPTIKDNGRILPYVEIDAFKYLRDEAGNKYGDIDILFYSPYHKTLYLVEFKNYCMTVSNSGSIEKDCNKAANADAQNKSDKRVKKFKENPAEFLRISKLNVGTEDISEIKSIILTSKPNAHYFSEEFLSGGNMVFDWIAFKDKAHKHEL